MEDGEAAGLVRHGEIDEGAVLRCPCRAAARPVDVAEQIIDSTVEIDSLMMVDTEIEELGRDARGEFIDQGGDLVDDHLDIRIRHGNGHLEIGTQRLGDSRSLDLEDDLTIVIGYSHILIHGESS